MEKIKFDKIREAIEADEESRLLRRSGRDDRKLLENIEKFNESPDEIKINFENRWGENGLEWKANATYYCAGNDFPTEIETIWFGDASGADKETSAICRVLNEIMPLRYRMCYAEEMMLRGKWVRGRETFFAGGNFKNGVGDRPLPGFVITGGIQGLKRAMRVLGYEAFGTIPLVFRRGHEKRMDTMDKL
ncbi:hypothetical protein [Selenomonas noxia]|uniref:hypothetical protein n=1 Tax=Selenomonas noxia TaxID=135083 RepID=UPI0028E6737D|nr:hypothetical protein [Selenomonas noxia]